MAKGKRKSSSGATKKPQGLDEDMFDEIDAFAEARDNVKLNNNYDSDDDSEEQVESVLDVESSSDSEDDSDSSDEESNQFKDKSGLDDEYEEETVDQSSQWGRSKKSYYDADISDVEDGSEESAQEEEQEAIRLQKKQLEDLDEGDFSMSWSSEPKEQKKSKLPSKMAFDDDDSDSETEVISKNLDSLSVQEKLDILSKDSPELLEFLEDYKMAFSELTNEVLPTLEALSESTSTNASHSLRYYNLKKQLLSNYLMNLSFYFCLKAKNSVVKDHPIIKQLVDIRTSLDNFGELDEEEYIIDSEDEEETDMQVDQKSQKKKKNKFDASSFETDAQARKLKKKKEVKDLTFKVKYDDSELKKQKLPKEKKNRKKFEGDFEETAEDFKPRKGKSGLQKYDGKLRHDLMNKARKNTSADFDPAYRDYEQERKNPTKIASIYDVDNEDPAMDFDNDQNDALPADTTGDNEYYEMVKEMKRKKKEAKNKPLEWEGGEGEEDDEGGRRAIGFDISKNKGMTPHRKKNNPRVKHKVKFDKAIKKRKTIVQTYKEGAAGAVYGGEATGIRANMIRSRPLS